MTASPFDGGASSPTLATSPTQATRTAKALRTYMDVEVYDVRDAAVNKSGSDDDIATDGREVLMNSIVF